ncbi:hypothetical protein BLNAU_12290 [Blattamonas nauphoetae]|uniref:Uncharacterized protein n=1 Tax=Blattamonas nauphoetae TaxID=2049346 RepID=A0ABQ9XK71_9EUKA|nr:hypothetical protein BLNAU_12290 [Blattamonas nauphoetae]
MSISQRETERLQKVAKTAAQTMRKKNQNETRRTRTGPSNDAALNRLSTPKSGPGTAIPTSSIVRGEQISEAIKAEYELIDTIKTSATNVRNKMVTFLTRHIAREQRRKTEFDYMKMELWAKVIDYYLEFQEEEDFPKDQRLLERAAIRKVLASYFEFWLQRSSHAFSQRAITLFDGNVEEHTEEIRQIQEDEQERGVVALIDIYIPPCSIDECEQLLDDYPYSAFQNSSGSPTEEELEEYVEIERKKNEKKDEAVAMEIGKILDDEEKGKELRDAAKETAISKGWENARDLIFAYFNTAITERITMGRVDDENDQVQDDDEDF